MASANQVPTAGAAGFDDSNIQWYPFGDFDGLVFAVLGLDEERGVYDLIVKFEADSRIFFHRHLALTNTLVIQGDHRIYEFGETQPREIRPVGTFTSSPPGDAHQEGGGPEGAVVVYSIRADSDAMFEVLDDQGEVAGILGKKDFREAWEEQSKA
jgi:hypothetical protein